MAISFDKALGDLPGHLSLYGERSSLLAANIEKMVMKTTHAIHLGGASAVSGADLMYRIPTQPSVDGNTVDTQVEQAEFAENAVRYQSTLTFLSGKFRSLKLAIKGE
jgi:flagellar basal-body rod protein FlgB